MASQFDVIIMEGSYCYNEVDNNSITIASQVAVNFIVEEVSFPMINLMDAIHSSYVFQLE